jgi:tetratricopeptide (TPR) repeat protein
MKRVVRIGMIVTAVAVTGMMAQNQQTKKGPMAKSQAELQAVQAVFTAAQQNNPDGIITGADNLLSKFKDTEFKDTVLFLEAQAYEEKGDKEKAQVYCERALTANPNSYNAALKLAELTVATTREHDLDRDEKLSKVDKYANQAITAINAAENPNPQRITEPQWTATKKDMIAEAHDALGLGELERKDYNKAIDEFKMAVEGAANVQPAYEVRLASAYQSAGKNDEAITLAQKVMDEPQTPAQIKSVAQSIRASAILAKNGGKAPAQQNAPPPQVEIKQQPQPQN